MTGLPVHYIIRDGSIITLEGMAIDPGGFRGEHAHLRVVDEHLNFWPETNLQHRNIDTVRTIVAKHLPENEPLPKRNWLQRWLTNPEPEEQPTDLRIVGDSSPIYTNAEMRERFAAVETPYADSLMDRLNDAHLHAISEARREAARDGVLVAVHHLEKHLDDLSNETMTDTIAHAVTRDCIDILRKLRRDMRGEDSGGA